MTCPKAADGLRRSANKSDDSVAIPRDEAIIRPVSFDLSSGLVRLYSPRSRHGVSNNVSYIHGVRAKTEKERSDYILS